jgi:hypothetical protein
MKLDTMKRDVQSDGMLNQRQFTIQAGAHIMAVLSGLYKDPIDAMVREYMTNMYDAYQALPAAKRATATPPELHLPTSLDSNLRFVDYGVGMSKETVWSVYTQYGNSTKNGTNNQVGGFGLGSKTAFCYNGGSSWIVESRFKGEKHVFMAFVGADSIPNMTHVSTEKTTEPNGVSVIIPIRREDLSRCQSAAAKYVPYFPMPITVKGGTTLDAEFLTPPKYAIRGKTWGATRLNRHRGMRVIMGNVPYPVDISMLATADGRAYAEDKLFAAYSKNRHLTSFFSYNEIDLYVPIGSCDIVPSRDSLKASEKTRTTILKGMVTVLEELSESITKELATAKTEWDALVMYGQLNTLSYINEMNIPFTWNGKVMNGDSGIKRSLKEFEKLDPSMTVSGFGVMMDAHGNVQGNTGIDMVFGKELSMTGPSHQARQGRTDTWILINDMAVGGMTMAKALINHKLINRSWDGRPMSYGHHKGHAIILENTKLTKKEISDFFGGLPVERIRLTSEIESLESVPLPVSLKPVKDTVYRWIRNRNRFEARIKRPTDKNKKLYVPLVQNAHTGRWSYATDGYATRESMNALIDTAQRIGVITKTATPEPIYGIKNTEIASLDSSWTDLQTAVEDHVAKSMPDLAKSLAWQNFGSRAHRMPDWSVRIVAMKLQNIPELKELVELNDKRDKLSKMASESYTMIGIINKSKKHCQTFEKMIQAETKQLPDLNQMHEAIKDKYPMLYVVLKMATDRYSHEDVLHENKTLVLDYCKSLC